MRVLALAYKPDTTIQNAEDEMVFLGLVGMIDPPRPGGKRGDSEMCRCGDKGSDDNRGSSAHSSGHSRGNWFIESWSYYYRDRIGEDG